MPEIYICWNVQILTDAGQYVIRFGSSDPSSKIGLASAVKFHPPFLDLTLLLTNWYDIMMSFLQIEDLEVSRKLTLAERAVTVALAISLDNDYFSRHGGW